MLEFFAALFDGPGAWLYVVLGFVAQLCDGALGMGFGAISSAALAALGVPRDLASASVNGAKVITGAASGTAHFLFGNVSVPLLGSLALAGAAGGALGALVLVHWRHWLVGVFVGVAVVLLGATVIARALAAPRPSPAPRRLGWIGTAGGVTEALLGVWGPLVTSSLVAVGVSPRHAVGTSSVAETFVAMAVVGALIGHLGVAAASSAVAGLVVGAVVAAPIGARLARDVPRRALAVAVGSLVVVLGSVRLYADLAALL